MEYLFKCKDKNKSEKISAVIGQEIRCKYCGTGKRKYTVDENYNLLLGTPPAVAKQHSLELLGESKGK